MKKNILFLGILLTTSVITKGQIIPDFDFGLKAGTNLSKLSKQSGFSTDNRAGYLAGIWVRAEAMGLYLQPELYYTLKKSDLKDLNGQTGSVDFKSLDLPVLIGTKFGALGIGGRVNTGPVISFIVDDKQSLRDAAGNAVRFNYKNQALAWQFGVGLDIRKISFDLRYEKGISDMTRAGYEDSRLNLYNISIGYKIY